MNLEDLRELALLFLRPGATTFELAKGSLVDVGSVVILLADRRRFLRFRVISSWLILGGGLVSVLARSLG